MEILAKIIVSAFLATAVCLLLRRSNPELALPLSAAVIAFIVIALASLLRPVLDMLEQTRQLSGLSEIYFLPVMKCVLIGICAKLAADLCRDGGQSSIAGAVELGGTVAALYVSMPLVSSFLKLVEKLL